MCDLLRGFDVAFAFGVGLREVCIDDYIDVAHMD